ncbi:MAG: hypothetical protein ACK40E_00135 [Caldimicrobium sp.]
MNDFFLIKSDIPFIEENIKKKKCLLIGGYGGYGKNFGDIIQAKSIIKLYIEKDFIPFILLHFQAIKEVDTLEEYKELFPEAILLFWSNYDAEVPYDVLVKNPMSIDFDILHLYGGGFLNEYWGKVMIESVEKSFQKFNINNYYISGQQISEKVVPYLKKHIEYYQPLILGTRDYESLNFLNKYGIEGIFSGDDSLEVLEAYSNILKQNLKLGQDVCFFHLNISDYTQEDFANAKNEIENLITALKKEGIKKFIFFHSYSRKSVIVKDTLKALDYLGISDIIPSFNVVSLPALIRSKDEIERVFSEIGNLGCVKYAFSNSYHTAFLFALSGIPTYLFAFNQYYRQKQVGLFGQQITLSEFLSNTDEIFKNQQEHLKKILEERRKFLNFFGDSLLVHKDRKSKFIPQITYTFFPSKSRAPYEIDGLIAKLYSKIEHLEGERLRLQNKIEHLEGERLRLQNKIEHLEGERLSLIEEKEKYYNELYKIYNSRGWKLLERYYTLKHKLKNIRRKNK